MKMPHFQLLTLGKLKESIYTLEGEKEVVSIAMLCFYLKNLQPTEQIKTNNS